MCTQICKDRPSINCSRTVLAELSLEQVPGKKLMAYVIIDEMSTTTLVDDRVVEYFGVSSQEYTMKFASQDCELHTAGKLVTGLQGSTGAPAPVRAGARHFRVPRPRPGKTAASRRGPPAGDYVISRDRQNIARPRNGTILIRATTET